MHPKHLTFQARVLFACWLVFGLLPGALWAQGRGPALEELLRLQRYNEAVPLLTARADKGDTDAQLMMGLLYFQGALPADGLGQGEAPMASPTRMAEPGPRSHAAGSSGWSINPGRAKPTGARPGMALR